MDGKEGGSLSRLRSFFWSFVFSPFSFFYPDSIGVLLPFFFFFTEEKKKTGLFLYFPPLLDFAFLPLPPPPNYSLSPLPLFSPHENRNE